MRTSLNHLKNVVSCVNRSYHLPFRPHTNTRESTSITKCLVNSRKYTSRRNPSIGKTPLLFFNSSTCIAIENSISCNAVFGTQQEGLSSSSLSLMGCLPTNLVTHSSRRLHKCFQLNCCQTQKVRSTCYQAHHTIQSLKISFGIWLHLSHVDYHGTTYVHFVNYLHRPG